MKKFKTILSKEYLATNKGIPTYFRMFENIIAIGERECPEYN